MMQCLLESTTVLLSMTTASPYCSCFYFLKQGLTFVRLLIFFFILWMCVYRHHVTCCSSLVEAASALLEEHRGRIFCVSLDRLFVSLDRSAALCSRGCFYFGHAQSMQWRQSEPETTRSMHLSLWLKWAKKKNRNLTGGPTLDSPWLLKLWAFELRLKINSVFIFNRIIIHGSFNYIFSNAHKTN